MRNTAYSATFILCSLALLHDPSSAWAQEGAGERESHHVSLASAWLEPPLEHELPDGQGAVAIRQVAIRGELGRTSQVLLSRFEPPEQVRIGPFGDVEGTLTPIGPIIQDVELQARLIHDPEEQRWLYGITVDKGEPLAGDWSLVISTEEAPGGNRRPADGPHRLIIRLGERGAEKVRVITLEQEGGHASGGGRPAPQPR